jgi:hypothetical protein
MKLTQFASYTLATLLGVVNILGLNVQKATASYESDLPNNYVTHLNLARGASLSLNMNAPSNGRFINSWANTNGDKDQELKIVKIPGKPNQVYIMKNGTNYVMSVKDSADNGSELEQWNYVPGAWQQVWLMQPATIAGGYTIRLAAKPWLGVTIPNSGHNRKVTLANIGNGDLSQEFGFSYGYQGSATVVPNAWVVGMPNVVTQTKAQKPVTNSANNQPISSTSNKSSNIKPASVYDPICAMFCWMAEDVGRTIVKGHKVIGVSLDKDGQTWEQANEECQRKGGFQQWAINYPKNYAEKTCFVFQGN